MEILILIASAIANSTPLIFACIGETITERAGIINLSAEGTLLMGAMIGFAVAKYTDNLFLGFLAASTIGAIVALILAFGSITLRQSQIAIGFVLTLLFGDLSSFFGNPVVRIPGPTVPSFKLPILQDIPILGKLFFQNDWLVYSSYLLIFFTWFYFYRTKPGLILRSLGEQPAAAYARGTNVVLLRYLYTVIGGALMGLAGAAFSLDFKAGWSYRHTAGYGWIALAIVIFGGWNPLRVALGAYLFGILQSLASVAQSAIPNIPTQVFSVAPFALMILVLVLTSSEWLERVLRPLPSGVRRAIAQTIRIEPPVALGKNFEPD